MKVSARRGIVATATTSTAMILAAPVALAAESSQVDTGSGGSSAIGVGEVLSWAVAFVLSALGVV